ncbi:MAG: M48 family metalloprotease [Candidatus Sericytochromatia bacterium]|nr:M48 family metalloprotease [Candidatus Sericytochromatia bacterium]
MHVARTWLVAGLVALSLAGCTARGALVGGLTAAQALFLSADDERRIGAQTRDEMLGRYPRLEDPAVQAYVQGLGAQLVPRIGEAGFTWEWHVIDTPEVNAFAAPAGYVFVTTGALRLMRSEAQLVGVLGHEVAHVVKHHALDGIRKGLLAQGVTVSVLGEDASQLAQLGAKLAATLVLKHGDRSQELESDTLGATWAYELGYDPRELGAFLDALAQQGGEPAPWVAWLSDHPGSNERLAAIEALVRERGMDLARTRTGTDAYGAAVLARLAEPPAGP